MPPRRYLATVFLASLAVTVSGRQGGAQTSAGQLEIGAARLEHRGLPAAHAVTLGGIFRVDAPRLAGAASGGLTLAGDDRSTGQAMLSASVLARPGGRWRWEVGGALTLFDQGAAPLSSGVYLIAREHLSTGRLHSWAGVGIGGIEDNRWWSAARSAEVGSVLSLASVRLSGTAVVVDTRSEPYGPSGNLVTDPVTYSDASLGVGWRHARYEVDMRAGMRLIARGALTASGRATRAFGVVDAAVRITPSVAIAASVGRHLSDLMRATPDTRFAAVALRLTAASRPPPVARRPPSTDGAPWLVVRADSAGTARLVVTAPKASRVELAATFTAWEAIPLVANGDTWILDRTIPGGAHRLVVRVNGGPWIVPANLPTVRDDFGSVVGLITMP